MEAVGAVVIIAFVLVAFAALVRDAGAEGGHRAAGGVDTGGGGGGGSWDGSDGGGGGD